MGIHGEVGNSAQREHLMYSAWVRSSCYYVMHFHLSGPDPVLLASRLTGFFLDDAVADVGGLRRIDHPDDLQLDARRQHVEQHRDLMDLQLVQHPGLKCPLCCVRLLSFVIPEESP
jgi:hypothetical protein